MKLVGIKETVMTSGKNQGRTGYTYYFEKPFSDYEVENCICQGVAVTDEFSYTKFDVNVGDEVSPVYDRGYQDKAILVNLVPFAPKPAK